MGKAQDKLLTVADVIVSIWQKLFVQKQPPPIVRVGAVQRIRQDAFEAWLDQHENTSSETT